MKAEVTEWPWSLEDMVALVDEWEDAQKGDFDATT
jgi:hypothetical protein